MIAIDPSINTIGFARLVDNKLGTVTLQVKHKPGASPSDKLRSACKVVGLAINVFGKKSDTIICEYPTFQNSQRGRIAATSGDILGLAAMCGYILGKYHSSYAVVFKTPMQWKGTVPKSVTGHRFSEWTGQDYKVLPDHEVDAAMLLAFEVAASNAGILPDVAWQPL